MSKTNYIGIDYGHGLSNIDHETGIRFGIISQNDILQAWADSSEPDYGEPHCPKCGGASVGVGSSVKEIGCKELEDRIDDILENWEHAQYDSDDYVCEECKYVFGSESAFPEETSTFTFEEDGYKAFSDEHGDVWMLKSPFFTYAQFCSPCAPGAVHLGNPLEEEMWNDNNRGYCFDKSWFEDEKAPYRVFRVVDGSEVLPEDK